jgi:hypothetical protein
MTGQQQEGAQRATTALRERTQSTTRELFDDFLEHGNPEEKLFMAEVMKTWKDLRFSTSNEVFIANAFELEIEQRGDYFKIDDEDLADKVRALIQEAEHPERQKANEEPWTLQKIRAAYSSRKPTGHDSSGRTEDRLGTWATCGESLTRYTPALPSAEREFLAFCQVLFRATDEDGDRGPDSELLVKLILEWSSRALNPQKVGELVERFNEQFKWRIATAKSVISEYPYAIGIDVVTQIELASIAHWQTMARMYPETQPSTDRFRDEIVQRIKNGAIVEPGLLLWEPHSKTIVERPAPPAEQPEKGGADHADKSNESSR